MSRFLWFTVYNQTEVEKILKNERTDFTALLVQSNYLLFNKIKP